MTRYGGGGGGGRYGGGGFRGGRGGGRGGGKFIVPFALPVPSADGTNKVVGRRLLLFRRKRCSSRGQ